MKGVINYLFAFFVSFLLTTAAEASFTVWPGIPGVMLPEAPRSAGLFIGVNSYHGGYPFLAGDQASELADYFNYCLYGWSWGVELYDKVDEEQYDSIIVEEKIDSFYRYATLSAGQEIDNFLLYISGHGSYGYGDIPNYMLLDSGESGMEYYLSDIELTNYLGKLPESLNKLVIIDSCYSGGWIDELKQLKNIYVITSTSSWWPGAVGDDGYTFFGKELFESIIDHRHLGFSYDDLVSDLRSPWYEALVGTRAYEQGAGDPIILTEEYFQIQTYQSPTYEAVPEPTSFVLVFCGLLFLYFFKKWASL